MSRAALERDINVLGTQACAAVQCAAEAAAAAAAVGWEATPGALPLLAALHCTDLRQVLVNSSLALSITTPPSHGRWRRCRRWATRGNGVRSGSSCSWSRRTSAHRQGTRLAVCVCMLVDLSLSPHNLPVSGPSFGSRTAPWPLRLTPRRRRWRPWPGPSARQRRSCAALTTPKCGACR